MRSAVYDAVYVYVYIDGVEGGGEGSVRAYTCRTGTKKEGGKGIGVWVRRERDCMYVCVKTTINDGDDVKSKPGNAPSTVSAEAQLTR